MANEEHVEIFLQGPEVWNRWREENPEIKPNLSGIDIQEQKFMQEVPRHDESHGLGGIRCRYVDISAYDLNDCSLERANLSATWASSAQLQGATLIDAQLNDTVLKEAQLQGALLLNAQLINATLSRAKLEDAFLDEADLKNTMLYFAKLQGAYLRGANLQNANLHRAQLQNANLQEAQLQNANLREAQLQNTKLDGAQLQHSFLLHVQFQSADLCGAQFQYAHLWGAQLQNASLNGAELQHAELNLANLQEASLQGAQLQNADLHKTQLQRTNLLEANLEHADLTGAKLEHANLRSANLKDANVTNVEYDRWGRYRGIRLEGAYGSPAFIRHAKDQDFIEEFRGQDLLYESRWANFLFIPALLLTFLLYLPLCFLPYGLLKLFGRNPDFTRQYEKDFRYAVYLLWLIFADCGRSFLLWTVWSVVMALGFAWIFHSLGPEAFNLGEKLEWSFHTVAYYSVVTFTTLGFGDVTPVTTASKYWVMAEVILGYVMLGGLISIFANKLARRSG